MEGHNIVTTEIFALKKCGTADSSVHGMDTILFCFNIDFFKGIQYFSG